MLQSCEGKLIQDVAKYCKSAMHVRNEKLETQNAEIYPHFSLDKSYLLVMPMTNNETIKYFLSFYLLYIKTGASPLVRD